MKLFDLYRYKVIDWVKGGSEMNFIIRIWSLLDRAFDDLFIETRRWYLSYECCLNNYYCFHYWRFYFLFIFLFILFRDKTSVAVSYTDNKDRIITRLAPIVDKMTSIRSDRALFRSGIEYGAAECGKCGDAKKELAEVTLHCPKILKNMFLFAADKCDNEKDLILSIRIPCFNQFRKYLNRWYAMWCDVSWVNIMWYTNLCLSTFFLKTNLHTSVLVMDNPSGYVCRVRSTPQYEVLYYKNITPLSQRK